MSGWQRIGVVISVLWLLGLSIFFVYDAYKNSTKYADFLEDVCMAGRHDSSPEGTRALTECFSNAIQAGGTEFRAEVAHTFKDVFLWIILLGPIILLWLVGWVVLGTVRWVRRGFTGPGR
jgi:hypothetical protein